MPKKSKKRARAAAAATSSGKRKQRRSVLYAAALSALILLAASVVATRYDAVRRVVGLRPLLPVAPAQGGAPLPLSKEYVYGGGRLVATEEPPPTSSGPPPTNLSAYASSVTVSSAAVTVTWSAPSSGSVASYIVERANILGQFIPVGQPVNAPTVTLVDTLPPGDHAYLYRVRAAYTGGGYSAYSNPDVATTVAFTDDPLVGANDPQGQPATIIYARHLTELRRAVNAVRALVPNMAAATWTHPDPVSSPPEQRRLIYLEDVQNLRDRLGEAFSNLGLSPPAYVDETLTRYVTGVKKEHVQQLRDAVR